MLKLAHSYSFVLWPKMKYMIIPSQLLIYESKMNTQCGMHFVIVCYVVKADW